MFHRDQLEGLQAHVRRKLPPEATIRFYWGVPHPVEDVDSGDLRDF